MIKFAKLIFTFPLLHENVIHLAYILFLNRVSLREHKKLQCLLGELDTEIYLF